MLNGITYTPALQAEAAPIFTALPEPLAAQLVGEMVRLSRHKANAAKMSQRNIQRVDSPPRAYGLLLHRIRHPLGDGPPAR